MYKPFPNVGRGRFLFRSGARGDTLPAPTTNRTPRSLSAQLLPKSFPNDKGIALDLRLRLQNGHEIDLEMQSANPDGTHARFLYYWAKNFAGSLKAGDDYTSLRPTISILWLKKPLLKVPGFHSIFHVTEDRTLGAPRPAG